MEPYPRRKPPKAHPAARDVLISSLRGRIKAAQKKIDKGEGDIVGQQKLKMIMEQQIEQLEEIELRELGPGTMENAAHQRLKKELEKKIRKKTQQVKQGRALDVNAPMLNGFKELLRQLTAVQAVGAGKRDRQEMEAGEANPPSGSAWKGKGKEVENLPSKVQNWFGNQNLTEPGVRGEINTTEKFVNAVAESGEEHKRKQIRTEGGVFGGGFGGSGTSRDQAHIPVIVLDGESAGGMDGNDEVMGNFWDGNGADTGSHGAEPDQEMTDAVPAAPVYRFGALGGPADANMGDRIPAAKFGTAGLLGFGTIRGIDDPMKNTFSGPLVSRSGPGPVFGTSGFGANSATFASAGAGKGKGASLLGGETAFGTGGGTGTGDSPILIEDSD